jgi:hypothetical protein
MADQFPAPVRPAPYRDSAVAWWSERAGRPSLGLLALGLAVALVVAEVVAIALANDGHWTSARVVAELVIALTVGSFVLGLVAATRHRGRRLGFLAAALSVLANPLVQIWLLGVLGGS